MNGEATRFKAGNTVAKKSPKVVIRKFFAMLENAKSEDEILSFQDACASIEWRDSKVNYWVRKLPVFATLKEDVQNVIIARINTKALKNEFNPTASIWRQKQLGEKDEKVVDNKSSDGSMSVSKLSPEAAKVISNKLDEEV